MKIELTGILVGFALSGFAFSIVALCLACLSWSTVVGLKNSTHQVQYVPIDDMDINDRKVTEDGEEENPYHPKRQQELHDKFEQAQGFKFEEEEYI